MHDILNPEQEEAALHLAFSIGLHTSPDFLPQDHKNHKKSKTSVADWRYLMSKYHRTQEFFNNAKPLPEYSERRVVAERNFLMTSEGFNRKHSNINSKDKHWEYNTML